MSEARKLSRRAAWSEKLADEVIRGVAWKIHSGELSAGDALPSRADLVAEFVTSDGVVEQALNELIAEGLAERGPDGALRVAAPDVVEGFAIKRVDASTLDDVVAIVELRIGVECESAALAATRRSEADMDAIRAAAQVFEREAERTSLARDDFEFHLAIGRASGNSYIHDLIEHLGPMLIPRMRAAIAPVLREGSDAVLQVARDEHQAIVDAIEQQDAHAARKAMRRHLTRTLDLVRGMNADR